MTDEETKAREEKYLNEHMGGGLLGASPEMIHDYVQHQDDMQVVNDLNPTPEAAQPSAEAYEAKAIDLANTSYGLATGDPVAYVEAGADVLQAAMDPHGQEVEQRLGQYGGTLPDGGLPDATTGSGSE